MSNKARFGLLLALLAILATCPSRPKKPEGGGGNKAGQDNKEPEAMTLRATHRVNKQNQPLGGVTEGPGFSIRWRGVDTPQGADPIDAIAAAADRLSHLQHTTAGGNELAKELWAVDKCLGELREIRRQREQAAKGGAGYQPPHGAGFGGSVESQQISE